jgi:hypothetical protein
VAPFLVPFVLTISPNNVPDLVVTQIQMQFTDIMGSTLPTITLPAPGLIPGIRRIKIPPVSRGRRRTRARAPGRHARRCPRRTVARAASRRAARGAGEKTSAADCSDRAPSRCEPPIR